MVLLMIKVCGTILFSTEIPDQTSLHNNFTIVNTEGVHKGFFQRRPNPETFIKILRNAATNQAMSIDVTDATA